MTGNFPGPSASTRCKIMPFLLIIRIGLRQTVPKRLRSYQQTDDSYGILTAVKPTTILPFIVSVAIMGACTPIAQPQPIATLTATTIIKPSETPAISATPPLGIEVQELTILPGGTLGDWTVIGLLENQSGQQLTAISIEVSVLDAADTLLTLQNIPLFLSHLGPGETSPFIAHFQDAGMATSANAEVFAHQTTSFSRAKVKVVDLSSAPTGAGGLAILGTIVNSSSKHVIIHNLGILGVDPDDHPIGFAPSTAVLSALDPGEKAPFLALMGADPGEVEFVPYLDATTTLNPGETIFSIPEPPNVLLTEQDAPLVVGSVRNDDTKPRWAAFLLILKLEEEIVAVAPVRPPIPLQPGESLAYAIRDFPGLRAQLARRESQASSLSAEIISDPLASRPTERITVPMDLQITQFEPIGSSLILKGVISNSGEIDVKSVTILVAVRSTRGELLTAGWSTIAETLATGDTLEFILPLSLPQGADMAMSEYDIQVSGLTP